MALPLCSHCSWQQTDPCASSSCSSPALWGQQRCSILSQPCTRPVILNLFLEIALTNNTQRYCLWMDAHCQRCLYETGCRSNQHSDTLLPVSLPRNSNTPGGGGVQAMMLRVAALDYGLHHGRGPRGTAFPSMNVKHLFQCLTQSCLLNE